MSIYVWWLCSPQFEALYYVGNKNISSQFYGIICHRCYNSIFYATKRLTWGTDQYLTLQQAEECNFFHLIFTQPMGSNIFGRSCRFHLVYVYVLQRVARKALWIKVKKEPGRARYDNNETAGANLSPPGTHHIVHIWTVYLTLGHAWSKNKLQVSTVLLQCKVTHPIQYKRRYLLPKSAPHLQSFWLFLPTSWFCKTTEQWPHHIIPRGWTLTSAEFASCSARPEFNVCMWFGEICSCCCLTGLPKLVWVLMDSDLQTFFSGPVYAWGSATMKS